MKPRKDLKDQWRHLCADLNEDDGLTPLEQKRQRDRRSGVDRDTDHNRSPRRLCAQAQRALHLALLADCHDADLQSLEITRVEPWPDARRLRVHLAPRADGGTDLDELAEKVQAVAHLLRHAVSQAVTRKRSPQLVFVIDPHAPTENAGDDA